MGRTGGLSAFGRDAWAMDDADQSHFIRDFKRFIRERTLFVRDVMRVRSVIGSPHPLGLMSSARYRPVGARDHRFAGTDTDRVADTR